MTDFKPDRPWNTVRLDAISDASWWMYELEEPAFLRLDLRAATVSQVGHDTRTSFSNTVVLKKRLTGDEKHHETTGDRYTHNRKGKPLCSDHNSGRCSNRVWGISCGDRPEHVHMCDKCWSSHISSGCSHQEMPQTCGSKKVQKGNGKSK